MSLAFLVIFGGGASGLRFGAFGFGFVGLEPLRVQVLARNLA